MKNNRIQLQGMQLRGMLIPALIFLFQASALCRCHTALYFIG